MRPESLIDSLRRLYANTSPSTAPSTPSPFQVRRFILEQAAASGETTGIAAEPSPAPLDKKRLLLQAEETKKESREKGRRTTGRKTLKKKKGKSNHR